MSRNLKFERKTNQNHQNLQFLKFINTLWIWKMYEGFGGKKKYLKDVKSTQIIHVKISPFQ